MKPVVQPVTSSVESYLETECRRVLTKKSSLLLLGPGLLFILVGFCLPALMLLLAPPGISSGQVFARLGRMLQDPYDLTIIGRTMGLGLLVTVL
jgi:putative spermidine/putrescine transport system permease protein